MIKYHSYSIEENELLYGSGKRLVLFCQGCNIRCSGCTNQHLWDKTKGKNISYLELVEIIQRHNLDGITLHGGEPIEQAKELLPLVKALKTHGKNVILFTGYEIEQLGKYKSFLNLCDIVKCGSFNQELQNNFLQFRGSSNQRILINKNGAFKDYKIKDGVHTVLLDVNENGTVEMRGMVEDEQIKSLMSDLALLNKAKQNK